jgi:hypothetical protein
MLRSKIDTDGGDGVEDWHRGWGMLSGGGA